ncbi:hypothetical protein ACFX2A_038624 [Malus domestica]
MLRWLNWHLSFLSRVLSSSSFSLLRPHSTQASTATHGAHTQSKRTSKARLGNDDESDAAKQGCPVMSEHELKEYEINLKDCGPTVLDALFMLFSSRSPQQYLHQYLKAPRDPAMASLSVTYSPSFCPARMLRSFSPTRLGFPPTRTSAAEHYKKKKK